MENAVKYGIMSNIEWNYARECGKLMALQNLTSSNCLYGKIIMVSKIWS